jgi:hypothetical protein
MNVPEGSLVEVFKDLNAIIRSNTHLRGTAVRWFNRLYFDVRRWNETFIVMLNRYPGRTRAPTSEELRQFHEELEQYWRALNGDASRIKANLCGNLRFLSRRFQQDFAELKDEQPDEFEQILGLIDSAFSDEEGIIDLARDTVEQLRARSSDESRERDFIEKYISKSDAAVDRLHATAQDVGVTLLTVSEYERALSDRTSSDSAILFINEVRVDNSQNAGGDIIKVVGSTFKGDNTHIGRTETHTSSQSADLAQMERELRAALSEVKEGHEAAVELLEGRLTEALGQANKQPKERDAGLLRVTADGLVQAAESVFKFAPSVIATAKSVAAAIVGLGT